LQRIRILATMNLMLYEEHQRGFLRLRRKEEGRSVKSNMQLISCYKGVEDVVPVRLKNPWDTMQEATATLYWLKLRFLPIYPSRTSTS